MAVVSDIEIRLRADIARLQQDMDRARQAVGGTMSKITQLAKNAGAALVGVAAGLSAAAFAGWIKGAIDATDAVSDISQRTGVAIKDIAGLQLWFQIGGAEAGEFESSMIKLAKTIASGTDEFKRIGVATRNADGSLRSNMEVLLDAGDAFQKLEDGTAKTALAIELFGKSGATLIPILNSGSQGLRDMTEMADKLGLTFDQETVDAAGQFNDTLDFLGLATQGIARQLAAQLLPALNSVAGSFLDFVVKGDGVRKAAEGIAAVLKTLYTVGIAVWTVFKTLGNTLAAAAAQIVAIVSGDFKAASNIGKIWKEEVAADFTSAAKTITDVWTDAGGETVAAMAGIQNKSTQVADKVAKDAAKQADAYATLIRSLQDRVDATARELAGLLPLNEAEKAHLDLTRQIQDGKLKLTATQKARAEALIDEARANEILNASNKEFDDIQKQLTKNSEDLALARAGLIDSAREEAQQNEFLAETFGMTEAAITRVQAARLLEQEAQRLGRELTGEEIEDLNRVIALKERSAAALGKREELEATKQFWTDIEKTAHDTFVSIADGGKNAFQRLKETAKNTFFDWLYQMTVKKWIVNIQAETADKTGIESTLNKVGISKEGAQKIGGTIGGYVTGTSLNKTISNGYETGSGFMTAQKVATAVGSYISPVLGAVVGAIGGVINRAFGMRAKEFSGTSTLNGSLGAGGFAGTLDTAWTQKGGLFRSDKSGVQKAAVDAAVAASLGQAYDAIKTSSADYASVLGLNADAIAARSQTLNIALGKDEAANEKAIADFFTGVANTVAGELLPSISKFQMAGEDATVTLQRLAVNYEALDQTLAAVGINAQDAFRAVGVASLEARERLISFAGGIEALATQTQFFNQNFLSQAEQIAVIQKPLIAQLEALGFAGITTAEQFKDAVQGLVKSGALATEQGAAQYAGLLAIAPQFKTVADYLKELSDAAAETAQNAKEAADALKARALADNETLLRTGVDSAFDAVSRAVDAQRQKVTESYAAVAKAFDAQISNVNESISRTTALSTALKGAIGVVASDMQVSASRIAAQGQVKAALALAKSSGMLSSADDLKDALSTLNQDSSDQFATLIEYQRDVARTNADLAGLGAISDKQLTEAQQQLASLEGLKEQSRVAYEMEMSRLDGILEWAQAEVDAINGVDRSIQSVVAAIAGLKVAGAALNQGATTANPTGGALSVEDLYRTVLGREGEAAGVAFWKNAFGDLVDANEYKEFIKGAQPELEMRQPPIAYMAPQSGTMQMTQSNDEMAKRMDEKLSRMTDGIEKFSSQFERVSNGGNALLMEAP